MQNTRPVYSIVIPTWNEASKGKEMEEHLSSIKDFFDKLGQAYEVVIVLDGPDDGTPELIQEKIAKIGMDNARVIKREENKGKGYTVREGLLAAEGQIRLFTDMDGATPITMFERMIPKFQEGADIVIGSRDLEESNVKIHQPLWKEWAGNTGNVLIQAMTGLWGVKDTQCGFKAFNEKSVKDIIPRATVNRWGIDFEILMMAKKLGYKVEQIPVEWLDKGESLVGLSGYFMTFRDLFKVKWNMIRGVYQLRKKVDDLETKKMA